ncbi:bacteriohemerythrin [Rhodospira trueperi]|uniref:Hemerythrin-like metal-binding domain protein n=1 Tax=Rhodospira trueperi TaxID=69960 RepID=A0A1G7BSD9_9PROT|nr:bacteriohemerythrin [Rhodospira trueperi]SDE29862.1 hemerythrin-like metal-binding domain protein [Rhodospira trueperi]
MGGQDHNESEIANGVIAAAQEAVSSLDGHQSQRRAHLHKLNELFTVVEQRYTAMLQDLHQKDQRIESLERTNEQLVATLRTLTDHIQDSVQAMESGDVDLATAISRSEALVSTAFGTGGNANPTQPPDTPPVPEPDPATDVLEDHDGEIEDLEVLEPVESDTESGLSDVDDLVFEEALPETTLPVLEETVALDPGPKGDPDGQEDADLDVIGVEVKAEAAEKAGGTENDTPLLTWTERWSVGVPEMDKDHRILISLINQLTHAFSAPESNWVVGSVLNSLWDYTTYHFNREEALLRAANFPGASEHAGRHVSLKTQVREWLDSYQNDPDSVDPHELQVSLRGWLMNHVLGEDMRYRPYVEHNTDAQAIAASITVDPELLDSLRDVAGLDDLAGLDDAAEPPT